MLLFAWAVEQWRNAGLPVPARSRLGVDKRPNTLVNGFSRHPISVDKSDSLMDRSPPTIYIIVWAGFRGKRSGWWTGWFEMRSDTPCRPPAGGAL